MNRRRRKGLIAAATALAFLVVVRAVLPIWLESAINAELGKRDLGEVGEVDLTLSRLNVELKDVQLLHVSPKGLTTLTKIASIDLNFHRGRLISLDGNSFRETLAGTLDKVRAFLENRETNTPEGEVPFEGEVSELDAQDWRVFRASLSNAFLRTLLEARVSP